MRKPAKGRRGRGTSRQPRRKKPAQKHAKPFEFLDHPADVGIVARGAKLPAVFAAAAQALCEYGWELDKVREAEQVILRARAATLEDLLYSWLSEILYLTDAEDWIFRRFRVARVERTSGTEPVWEIEGSAAGEKFDAARHQTRTYIKAVTYHQLEVKQKKGGWEARVYLDV